MVEWLDFKSSWAQGSTFINNLETLPDVQAVNVLLIQKLGPRKRVLMETI